MKAGINRAAIDHFFDTVKKRQTSWGSHGVPRASSIGNDLRQQWFSAMHSRYPDNPKYAAAPIEGESIWGMEEGHWQEPEIYQVLREEGYLVSNVQAGAVRYLDPDGGTHVMPTSDESMTDTIDILRKEGSKPFLTMHIDGEIEGGPDAIPPTLLELKKATMFSFGGMVQNGIRQEKRTFWFQASACAASFGLPYARLMIFTRDRSATNWYFTKMRSKNPITENPALYIEDMPVDPRLVRMADLRALALLDYIEKEECPPPDPEIWPLNVRREKNGELTHLFPCGWCEYKEPCLRDLRLAGHNINEYVVIDDLRSKKEKETDVAV